MPEYTKKLPICIAIFLWFGALVFALIFPFQHGPDINYYFGVALRISRGQISESVDGMYSPLLSWILAPLHVVGIPLSTGYRLINLVAFGSILVSTLRLSRAIDLTPIGQAYCLSMVGAHLIYFVVGQPSSDLLAAALFTALVSSIALARQNISRFNPTLVGLLAGLSYLAKAIEFPIIVLGVILSVMVDRLFPNGAQIPIKEWAKALVFFFAFSIPWITIISNEYGTPVISGQQLLQAECRSARGVPKLPREIGFSIERCRNAERASSSSGTATISERIQTTLSRIQHNLDALKQQLAVNYFGIEFCVLYGLVTLPMLGFVVFSRTSMRLRFIGLMSCAHVVGYLAIWGPHFRYYLPAISLLHLLFVYGIERSISIVSNWATRFDSILRPTFSFVLGCAVSLVLVSPIVRISGSVYLSAFETNQKAMEYFASLPELASGSGIVTGRLYDPYSGNLAYRLGREFWGAIDLESSPDARRLGNDLDAGKVDQIWWVGEQRDSVERLNCFVKIAEFKEHELSLTIFQRASAACSRDRSY